MGNQLNDNDFGTRDKRGHWKPFGTISINPPKDIFFNPIKFLKYFFKFPGIFFPWTFVFAAINSCYISFFDSFFRDNEDF